MHVPQHLSIALSPSAGCFSCMLEGEPWARHQGACIQQPVCQVVYTSAFAPHINLPICRYADIYISDGNHLWESIKTQWNTQWNTQWKQMNLVSHKKPMACDSGHHERSISISGGWYSRIAVVQSVSGPGKDGRYACEVVCCLTQKWHGVDATRSV